MIRMHVYIVQYVHINVNQYVRNAIMIETQTRI